MKEAFIGRVDALVAAMRQSPSLRAYCLEIANDSINSCHDRIALGMNDMEREKISHEAENGLHPNNKLFSMARQDFRLHALNVIVETRIEAFIAEDVAGEDNRHFTVDEVEVRLAYQMELADRLDLPGIGRAMLYRPTVMEQVSDADIDAAGAQIEARMKEPGMVEHVAQWKPWRMAMERTHPAAYASLRQAHAAEQDALEGRVAQMTDGEIQAAWKNLTEKKLHNCKN